jgi:hypothetical protein
LTFSVEPEGEKGEAEKSAEIGDEHARLLRIDPAAGGGEGSELQPLRADPPRETLN